MSEIEYDNWMDGIEVAQLMAHSDGDLLSSEIYMQIYDIEDLPERTRVINVLLYVAKVKGVLREVKSNIEAYEANEIRLDNDFYEKKTYETGFSFQLHPLRCGAWLADNRGVRLENSKGELKWASRIPIVPELLIENVSSGVEKVQLAFVKSGARKKQTIICDRATTASNSSIVKLANKGVEVTSENAKLLVRYISDVITLNLDSLEVCKGFSQLGWSSEGFLPFAEDAVFDGEDDNRYLFQAIAKSGDFEAWRKVTHELRSSLHIRMAMAASFASVLIEKVGALPFVFHLWGKSGTGKTVALKIAMSIWGNPKMGKLTRTMNMTQNAMLSTAAFLKNIPFAGDELQTIKSRWDSYDQLIMRITEGIDRGRMTDYGKQAETKTWSCSFLFTGEDPCTGLTSGGGVKNRVIEMEITDPMFLATSGNEANNFVEANYGYAGEAFVEYVEANEANIRRKFTEFHNQIMEKADTTEKQAASMALILLADELACECIYEGETPLRVDDVSHLLLHESEIDVAERAYEYVVDLIGKNQKRFDNTMTSGEVWGRIYEDQTVRINLAVLREQLSAAGFVFDAVKKTWAQSGYLKKFGNDYAITTTCFAAKARYVQLTLPDDDRVDEHDYDGDIAF